MYPKQDFESHGDIGSGTALLTNEELLTGLGHAVLPDAPEASDVSYSTDVYRK
jgi:hypothetical protein